MKLYIFVLKNRRSGLDSLLSDITREISRYKEEEAGIGVEETEEEKSEKNIKEYSNKIKKYLASNPEIESITKDNLKDIVKELDIKVGEKEINEISGSNLFINKN